MEPENRNYAWAGAFVDELARAGLKHVCICPGSRSTPIAISFARHQSITKHLHLDERSASFFALGIALAEEEPVAVLCTSGTAAANFLPAVIESNYANVPLIVITTDRPPELWEWGAHQTIDQLQLFGNHPKWSVSMPPPQITPKLLRYVRALATRLYWTARTSPSGPVHVNMPFRDPLSPANVPEDFEGSGVDLETLNGRSENNPYVIANMGKLELDQNVINHLSRLLPRNGIIVCGPQRSNRLGQLIKAVGARLGYPVLADPLSQIRGESDQYDNVIDNYDLFLRDPEIAGTLAPAMIIRFGGWPTSATLNMFLETYRDSRHMIVTEDGWNDPAHLNSELIRVEPTRFCESLLESPVSATSTSWLKKWLHISTLTKELSGKLLKGMNELFEGKLFTELEALLPEESALFLGNSMPVRDMDTFFPRSGKSVQCLSNRGANGIDGVISTALGFGSASRKRTVLIIGDLSFYHDMNGLLAAKRYRMDTTIVVINNDGGGIFSFLPQSNYPEFFEDYLGTPHGLTFDNVAELYDLPYVRITNWNEFRNAFSTSVTTAGPSIIEVLSNRQQNQRLHQQFADRVLRSLRKSYRNLKR